MSFRFNKNIGVYGRILKQKEAVSKIKIEAAFFILTLESKIFESLVF